MKMKMNDNEATLKAAFDKLGLSRSVAALTASSILAAAKSGMSEDMIFDLAEACLEAHKAACIAEFVKVWLRESADLPMTAEEFREAMQMFGTLAEQRMIKYAGRASILAGMIKEATGQVGVP